MPLLLPLEAPKPCHGLKMSNDASEQNLVTSTFEFPELITREVAPELNLIDILIVWVRPQLCRQVVYVVNAHLSFSSLKHLKRVKKEVDRDGKAELWVLLADLGSINVGLPAPVQAVLDKLGLESTSAVALSLIHI